MGMNAFCKALVTQNIAFQMRVVTLEETAIGLWSIEASDAADSRHSFLAKHVFLTPPLPQALALLNNGGFASQCAPLASVTYDPCIVMIMGIPRKLSAQWPAPVWMLPTESTANTAGNSLDNFSPKIAGMFIQHATQPEMSDVLAIHLSHASSQSLWNETDETIFQGTLECMRKNIEETIPNISLSSEPFATLLSVHRWRYSRCRESLPMPFFKVINQSAYPGKDRDSSAGKNSPGCLYLAGDAFIRSTIEGAYLSGHAAAKDLLADGI
jgi:predicted NAD/FAD-dependent oxidoreductase